MATVRHRIPRDTFPALPAQGYHDVRVRARTPAGPSEPSIAQPSTPTRLTEKREVWHNGRWVRTDEAAFAQAMSVLFSRTVRTESESVTQAAELTRVSVEIGTKASAYAVDGLQALVRENDGELEVLAERITELRADLASYATAMALNVLTTRVVQNERGIFANAAEITALEAAHGGRTLGPATNLFSAATKAEAAALRDVYASQNPMVTWEGTTAPWLTHYDGDNDINIELRWGVEYIYQRRVNGRWVDNGEALARAAAVAVLNASVESHDSTLTSLSQQLTSLTADIGSFTAGAFQELTARVTRTENVDGSTKLSGLARWLVKTRVNDLVGGVGLYNNGSTTEFIVRADRFAIVPPNWNGSSANKRVPFAVQNGIVYIDSAALRRGSISESLVVAGGMNGDVVIRNGTMSGAKLRVTSIADILNLVVGNEIKSSNYVAGRSGWRIRQSGAAEFHNAIIRGSLSASDIRVGTLSVDRILQGSLSNAFHDSAVLSRGPSGVSSERLGSLTITGAVGSRYFATISAQIEWPANPTGKGLRILIETAGVTTFGNLDISAGEQSGAVTVSGVLTMATSTISLTVKKADAATSTPATTGALIAVIVYTK